MKKATKPIKEKEDPDKILKYIFTSYIETKEVYEQHLFYKNWLQKYFNTP